MTHFDKNGEKGQGQAFVGTPCRSSICPWRQTVQRYDSVLEKGSFPCATKMLITRSLCRFDWLDLTVEQNFVDKS